jgi:hypothetical protein
MSDLISLAGVKPFAPYRSRAIIWDDFIIQPPTTNGWQFIASTGSGGGVSQGAVANNPSVFGVVQTTLTGVGSYSFLATNGSVFGFTGGEIVYESSVKLGSLSDGTDKYLAMNGIFDVFTGLAPVDGAWFSYQHDVNSGNWTINASLASAATALDSGIAVSASAYTHLKIVVNATGTSISYFVNGVQCANSPITNALYIPGVANNVGLGHGLKKLVGTAGRGFHCDYIFCMKSFTTARS